MPTIRELAVARRVLRLDMPTTTRELTAAINARDWADEQTSIALAKMSAPADLHWAAEVWNHTEWKSIDWDDADDDLAEHYRGKYGQDR